ncbi:uncharacterized protein LTR77_001028 [Saxophila tyrrhenica]|uniref:Carboxymuconolactone decarboxylase-like domain-containing protein n=1 Tax=Saxophila tyrrhenica TaxID=1690608 RepID=A0AAV9PU70_9PEZI|nr:hypothetical protein LTR77_001028 [Saxophila tyrrhenica]
MSSSSTYVVDYSPEEIEKAHAVLYNEGLRMRIQVAGKEYVEKSLNAAKDPFSKPMQEFVAEACWGWVWSRPGLELKTRSFLNIVMLCCQNRSTELATHVRGALNNGATEEEIREVILQATAYCGMPAGIEGFRVAGKAIEGWKAEQKSKGEHMDRSDDVGVEQRMNTDDV